MRPQHQRRFRPCLEALQGRDLPAVTAAFAGGILSVTGTDGPDTIEVRQDNGRISVVGVPIVRDGQNVSSVASADVTQIVVAALGGNDRVKVGSSGQAITQPTDLDGGAGDDEVEGGAGADVIR